MSKRIEKMLRNYPQMVMERRCLEEQLAHFKGVSDEDIIESMYTPKMDGERVQTSGTSDKTAQIAMSYQERLEKINSDWQHHLEWRLNCLVQQLTFLESAMRCLPEPTNNLMWDMVVGQMTWEELESKYYMSHSSIYRTRRRAIAEIDRLYESHLEQTTNYILN